MRLSLYPNLTGLRGTERTVSHMRRLVEAGKTDPLVVLQAHKIVRNIDRNNWTGMASAIFRFVHDNVAYVRDPVGVEFVKSPAITLKTRTGDCDDQAVLFSALAESIGITTRFKAVKADPKYPGEFSHVYSQANIPGRGWVSADTIVPKATFGWEVQGHTGKTWGGGDGMSFIGARHAAGLGSARFAAGLKVLPDTDLELDDTTFGDVFGGGGMWDDEPILTGDKGEIDTIVDADEDHWGGSSDTPGGPGMVSRMLPPGMGAGNALAMGDLAGGFKSLGKAFKKMTKKVQSNLKSVGKKIEANVKSIGTGFTKLGEKMKSNVEAMSRAAEINLGVSTPESRAGAARAVVGGAMEELWNQPGIQIGLEMLRRAEDVIASQKEGRLSQYLKGPPPALSGVFGGAAETALATQILETAIASDPTGRAIMTVSKLIKGLGDAKDAEAAQKAATTYVTNFPKDRMDAALKAAAAAFIAAGGMMPSVDEKAPEAWLVAFSQRARVGKPAKGGQPGWRYWDIMYLVEQLEQVTKPLSTIAGVFGVAHAAYTQTAGAQVIQVSASIVEQALAAGTISPSEAAAALALVKRQAEGYALTPEEQALAARIAAGARAGGKGWILPAAAATVAVAAALLI